MPVYLNYISCYTPENKLPNSFFAQLLKMDEADIFSICGVKNRAVASKNENTNTMAVDAVRNAFFYLPLQLSDFDLIVGATYTPHDTIFTPAHAVQRFFGIEHAKCFTVSSACSSFVNALEIASSFLQSQVATKAIVVASDHNTAYADFQDEKSGFIWGDGAAAAFISNEQVSDFDFEIVDVHTAGLGHIHASNSGVVLKPRTTGLTMPDGRSVFQYACHYMLTSSKEILKKNNIPLSGLQYFIPHQANARIINYVARELKIPPQKVLGNIEQFGNTGSASAPIVLAQNLERFSRNDLVLLTTFGGGFSSGSVLLRKI